MVYQMAYLREFPYLAFEYVKGTAAEAILPSLRKMKNEIYDKKKEKN